MRNVTGMVWVSVAMLYLGMNSRLHRLNLKKSNELLRPPPTPITGMSEMLIMYCPPMTVEVDDGIVLIIPALTIPLKEWISPNLPDRRLLVPLIDFLLPFRFLAKEAGLLRLREVLGIVCRCRE